MRFQPRVLDHERERSQRHGQTRAEKMLWSFLRRLPTFKFRRQHRIDPFIVDFYCAEVGLAVEVDGSTHFSEAAKQFDRERDAFLRRLGVSVLRFSNDEVINDVRHVVAAIVEACCYV